MTEGPRQPQNPAHGRPQESGHRPVTPTLSRFAHRLPVPAPAPVEEKKPFWRRLGLTRSGAEQPPTASLEPLLRRIAALEAELQAHRSQSEERLAAGERRVRRLEERSRQVSLLETRQRLEGLEIDQAEAEEALEGARRSLRSIAGLAGLALVSAAGALFAFFYLWAAL